MNLALIKDGERTNSLGGYDPATAEAIDTFRQADLITLPRGIAGTNCGNCGFFRDGFCAHRLIRKPVTVRMCCSYWSRPDVERVWRK